MILGLDRCTPGYLIREETEISKIEIEAGERVLKFEEKIKNQNRQRVAERVQKNNEKERMEKDKIGNSERKSF